MKQHYGIQSSRWDLIGCALSGHETYMPTGSEQAIKLASRLRLLTPQGDSWRCLRCGTYVIGEPKYRSTLANAPLVVRGKVLKQTLVLRFLAVERGVRAILLIALGAAIVHFRSSQGSLQRVLQSDLPALQSIAHSLGYNIDSSKTFLSVEHGLSLTTHTLNLVAVLVFAYAAILAAETVGLWLIKRWGEYFSAIATSVFIPLEIYELTKHISFLKMVALVINILAVLYLITSKRLFGVRGGDKAYEKSLEGDNLLEISKSSAGKK